VNYLGSYLNFRKNYPLEAIESENVLTRRKELIGAMIALKIRLLSEQKLPSSMHELIAVRQILMH